MQFMWKETLKSMMPYNINEHEYHKNICWTSCSDMVLNSMALNIADLLCISEAEKEANVKRQMFYETLTHDASRSERPPFRKYNTNLK